MNEKPTTRPVAEPGPRRRKRSALVYVLGFVALAVLPVLALNSLATADTAATAGYGSASAGYGSASAGYGSASAGYGSASAVRHPVHPHLTPERRQCLAAHGVTLPTDVPGSPRTPLTQAQRDAFRVAAVACGIPSAPGDRHPVPGSK